MQSLPHTSPTVALSCPWCNCPSSPGLAPQVCQGCRRRFTLSPGPALDASVIAPPPHPSAYTLHLKWSMVVTYRFARLEAGGLTSGTLDPVVALAEIDRVGIAFPDVMSIAVWRKLGWVDCIVGALVPVPIALFSLWGAILCVGKSLAGFAIFGVVALVFGLLAFFLFRRGAVTGKRQARVTGRYATITVPFSDTPAFHPELFRRCGLAAPPIP